MLRTASILIALTITATLLNAVPINTGRFSGTAIKGYDPVAYFTQGKPVRGKGAFKTKHKGATWKFSSQENLDSFVASPEKYEPKYGGYCAWAAAQEKTMSINPKNWKIIDGELYLLFSDKVQRVWEDDMPSYIDSADEAWPKILEKKAK